MKSIKCNIIKAGRGDVYGRPFAIGQIYTGPFDYVRQLVSCGYATVDDAAVFDDDSTPQNSEIAIVGKGRMAVEAELNEVTGGISLSAGSQVLTGTPVMTFAELKTALTAGFVGTAFVSDVGGGTIWVSDGTKAKPIGGTIDIYQSTTSSAFTTSVTRNVGSAVAIPAGLIGAGDTLEVGVFSSKSGATDTGNIQVNLGDSAGAVGVQLGGTIASLNYIAATRRSFGIFRFRIDSNTSLTLLNGATGQDGSISTSAISACVSTVSDLSSAVRYLQISNAMGAGSGDIITIEKLLIRLSK